MDNIQEVIPMEQQLKQNLGTRSVKNLPMSKFPDADLAVRAKGIRRPPYKVDVLLVNPPTPDKAIWIRSQHRVGRRSRENMIWPQMELAQMAAMLMPDYTVEIIDANALRMTWPEFEAKLKELRPRFYLTQVTAPTLDQRYVRRVPGAQPGRDHDGVWHARHTDAARNAGTIPRARFCAARRA